jgi:4-amino-4-deoxy-L-arabinose transferase-like glycosyltransferase
MVDTLLTVPFLLLAVFFPGYLVVSWFTNRQASSNDLKTLEAVVLSFVLSASFTGTIALILAQTGMFRLPLLAVALVLACVGLATIIWYSQKSLRWRVAPSVRGDWLAVLAIVVGSSVLFLRPHEYVYGGGDAGVYVSLGANLDETGALLVREPLVAELDPALLPGLLREQQPGAETRFIRLPGFYLSDSDPGLIIPQFYPLHPVWLGIGYGLGGTSGALLVTPIWAVWGLVAVYLLGSSIFNRWVGLLAAVLLMIMPLQMYFARYPTAEPITQFFTWAFLWAFTMFVAQRSQRELWGLGAGVTCGLVYLARIDALPLLLVPAGWALILAWRRRWDNSEWWFWMPLLVLIGYSVFHGLVFSRPYTMGTYGAIVPMLWNSLWFLFPAALGALGIGLLVVRLFRRWHLAASERTRWHHVGRLCGAALLVALALYVYFVRPRTGEVAMADYWYSGAEIPITNHENLVRLGWYLTPLGIALAVAGSVLLLLEERLSELWPLWVAGGGFTVLYLYNIFNNPYHIYAMRRYVPVVVPFLLLLGAYAIWWLWQQRERRQVGRVAGGLLFVLLLGWLAYGDRLIWQQVDYEGAVEQVDGLAGLFADNAIVLFEDDPAVGLGAILGTPLQFLHGITSFDLQEAMVDRNALEAQIAQWSDEGYTVYVARNSNASVSLINECLVPAGAAHLDTPFLEASYDHPPSAILRVRYDVEIYRVEPFCIPGG